MSGVRVAIAMRKPIVAEGVAALLGAQPQFVPVYVGVSLAGLAEAATRARPDIVIAGRDVIFRQAAATLRKLRTEGGAPVLIVAGASPSIALRAAARRVGADGTVHLEMSAGEFAASVWALADALAERHLPGSREHTHVSAQDRIVLSLIAAGLSNKEIAQRMNVRLTTVKHHIAKMLARLGFDDRTQLAVYYVTHLEPPPQG